MGISMPKQLRYGGETAWIHAQEGLFRIVELPRNVHHPMPIARLNPIAVEFSPPQILVSRPIFGRNAIGDAFSDRELDRYDRILARVAVFLASGALWPLVRACRRIDKGQRWTDFACGALPPFPKTPTARGIRLFGTP